MEKVASEYLVEDFQRLIFDLGKTDFCLDVQTLENSGVALGDLKIKKVILLWVDLESVAELN